MKLVIIRSCAGFQTKTDLLSCNSELLMSATADAQTSIAGWKAQNCSCSNHSRLFGVGMAK